MKTPPTEAVTPSISSSPWRRPRTYAKDRTTEERNCLCFVPLAGAESRSTLTVASLLLTVHRLLRGGKLMLLSVSAWHTQMWGQTCTQTKTKTRDQIVDSKHIWGKRTSTVKHRRGETSRWLVDRISDSCYISNGGCCFLVFLIS